LAARVGTNVAAGDVNGDGVDEIITAPRDGGPYVRVFKKDGKAYGAGIWAFPRNARGSFDVAAGDVNGDGKDEIIVSKSEGKSTVKIFKYDAKKTLVKEFDALGSINVGVRVAAGDVDNDGKAEVIVGAGKGGDAIVRVFESNGKAKKIEFYAYAKGYRDGIDVAAGDTDGDGKAEIAVSKLGKQSLVKVFRYNKANKVLGEWTSYGAAAVGSYVAMGDIDSDGKAEVVTIAAEGGAPYVRGYEKNGVFKKSLNFYAYGKNARIGGDVAFGAF
ncbi:MAG: Na-Ca exchanger/integrin-beta4, partial [uncultured bacterium]